MLVPLSATTTVAPAGCSGVTMGAPVADAGIESDRRRHAGGERALDDRLDRRQARAAGDGEDRPGVLLAQERAAERPLDLDRIADAQRLGDIAAGAAPGGAPDMEL